MKPENWYHNDIFIEYNIDIPIILLFKGIIVTIQYLIQL